MKPVRNFFAALLCLTAWCSFAADNKPLTDIAYGSSKHQIMDIYVPPNVHAAPVIFMVHGGGWRYGDKDNGRVVENKTARWLPQGFIFISIDYRMLPELNGLQQADDVARALAYAQSHAADWGGDPQRFILMGHSAGAHLVALLNAAPEKAYAFGAKPWLGTVALDSAAYDIPNIMERRHLPLYDHAFGTDRTLWEQASPIYVVNRNSPPLLAVCSTKRRDKPCDQVDAYAKKARALGLQVNILEAALSHGEINENLGLPGAYTNSVAAFIDALAVK